MKLLVLFALALATASQAFVMDPLPVPVDQPLEEPLEQPLEEPLAKPVFIEDLKVENPIQNEGRITNGESAYNGQFPYQVGLSLQSNGGGFWCGGTLISPHWILTAAHCTDGAHTVTAYLGNVWRTGGHQVTVGGNHIRQHSGYNRQTLANDVSLIHLPSAVPINNEIRTANLPNDNWSYAGWQSVTSGWGQYRDGSGVVDWLQWTRQPIMENWECANTYGGIINGGTICIHTHHGAGTCQGDSGGPLVLDGTWTLVGVTSFVSSAGCQAGHPAGFARVGTYRNWIRDISGV